MIFKLCKSCFKFLIIFLVKNIVQNILWTTLVTLLTIDFHIAYGKALGSRPSPIIDSRGGLIVLILPLIAVLVSNELDEGEDNYWCLELDSSREFSFQGPMLRPNNFLQKALKSSK